MNEGSIEKESLKATSASEGILDNRWVQTSIVLGLTTAMIAAPLVLGWSTVTGLYFLGGVAVGIPHSYGVLFHYEKGKKLGLI